MVALLQSGEVDGFCVGAPWSEVAEAQGAARILIRASEIWPGGPDKVLGVSETWAERNADALHAMLRALIGACAWADAAENRPHLAAILARPDYVDAPQELIARSLDDIVFHADFANFPWPSHAAWFLSQMLRWGQIERGVDVQGVAARVYRPDLYRTAAKALGLEAPSLDDRVEDAFFDGRVFDPADPARYAAAFEVTRSGGTS
jgi:NitT/TauT family transport system ATP-binding protein/nitrate/nitrite transport system substrate-binding protein